jgi:type II secretory pathway pseudopilin PulG
MADKINKTPQALARPRFPGNLGGFTIVELLIATTIFSLVLLVTLASFLNVGKNFFKGVTSNQSQDTSKAVLDDLAAAIRTAPNVSPLQTAAVSGLGAAYKYICIGNTRYTYGVDSRGNPIMYDANNTRNLNPSNANANFGLIRDKLPGSSACAAPCYPADFVNCGANSAQFNNPRELLSDQMRVGYLGIGQSNSTQGAYETYNLYVLNLVLAYGGDTTAMNFDLGNPDINSKVTCKGSLTAQQFCSVTVLSTSVFRGLQT